MTEEVYIEGKKLDLSDRIGMNFQSTDLSDLSSPKTPYTGSFIIPRSSYNDGILNVNTLGASEPSSYEDQRINIVSNGVPILMGGRSFLQSSTPDGYEINVIGRNIDVFKRIGDVKLNGLQAWINPNGGYYSTTPATWSSWDIRYGHLETWLNPYYWYANGGGSFNVRDKFIAKPTLIPYMKKSTLVRYVLEHAGYTVDQNDLGDYTSYDSSYVCMNAEGHTFVDQTYYLYEWHDVDAVDFLKSVIMQYGIIMIPSGDHIKLTTINRLTSLKSNSYRWEDRMISEPSITYDVGYGYKNDFKYSHPGWGSVTEYNGTLTSDNKNLDNKEVADLVFNVTRIITDYESGSSSGRQRNMLHVPAFDPIATTSLPSLSGMFVEYPFHDIIIPYAPNTYLDGTFSAETWLSGVSNGSIYTAYRDEQYTNQYISNGNETQGLSFNGNLIPEFWDHNFIKRPLMVTCKMTLSPMDVQRFSGIFDSRKPYDSITPVYIPELGEHFYVNRITNFIAGGECNVELIRL